MSVEIMRVVRGGDFQTIYFSDGTTVWGSSEEDVHGWHDSRGIQHIIEAFGFTGEGSQPDLGTGV